MKRQVPHWFPCCSCMMQALCHFQGFVKRSGEYTCVLLRALRTGRDPAGPQPPPKRPYHNSCELTADRSPRTPQSCRSYRSSSVLRKPHAFSQMGGRPIGRRYFRLWGCVSSSTSWESGFAKRCGRGLVVSVLPSLLFPVAPSAVEKPVTPSDPVAAAPPARPSHRA